MSKLCAGCEKWSPYLLGVMRVVVAALFICHGTQKLFGYPSMKVATPPLFSMFGIGGMIELVGGLFVMFGIFTRPAAFVMSGEMAVAYFKYHISRGWWPIHNQGELAIVYCFVFLYLSAAGAGPLSLDHLIFGRRSDDPPA